mgnify:CR=1 FL=1
MHRRPRRGKPPPSTRPPLKPFVKLVLYLCVPLVYLALLYRVSDRLHAPPGADPEERKLKEAKLLLQEESDPELRPLKFLFKGYRPQFWCVSNCSVLTYSLNK